MMNNIIFVKFFIFLTIIVTNATAYDTCLSPRTKDQDCDCDILRPMFQNQRNNGYLIEFAVCRDYKDEGGDIMPLAVLVTPYDPVNTLPVYSKGKKIGESHWFNVILPQKSWRTNWKPWSWSTGGTRWYCPDITIAGVEGGDQGNAEYKGHWKKKHGDDVQTATDLVCPKSQASTTVTYSTYDRNKDAAQQNYIGIRQTFCPTSTWYLHHVTAMMMIVHATTLVTMRCAKIMFHQQKLPKKHQQQMHQEKSRNHKLSRKRKTMIDFHCHGKVHLVG